MRSPFALSNRVLIQFAVVVFLVVALLTGAAGTMLQEQLREVLIQSRLDVYPRLFRIAMEETPAMQQYLTQEEHGPPPEEVVRFLTSISSALDASWLKLWSADRAVLWSDDGSGIGGASPDNGHIGEALSGTIAYEAKKLDADDTGEAGPRIALEVYSPISRSGTVLGALTMHVEDTELAAEIREKTVAVWLWVIGGGLVLYGLLFLIFFRAYRKQRQSERELIAAHDATIFSLAHQAELRDQETGDHLQRTATYVSFIAHGLRVDPQLASYLTDRYVADLVRAAPLHDIGKVAISDTILLKPGRLTAEETRIMQQHTEHGAETLRQIEERLGFQTFLRIAVEIAHHHHERWDGAGYPTGLAGEDIPLSARIMALADVYDALRSKRPYKEPMNHEETRQIIITGRGTQFDPAVVDSFLEYNDRFSLVSTYGPDAVTT